MTPRLASPAKAAPDAYQAMLDLEQTIAAGGLEHSLLELVKIRVSQINGCAYCLHLLAAWRESSLFSPRERAALTWAESLTRIEQTQASDADYAVLKAQFTETEQVNLTFAIGAINVWNRLAVGFRSAHPAG
jgi:alkylhydroperoxidase family enzyme